MKVLIQWKDLPELDVTWEAFKVINQQFSNFHREDKVKLLEGNVVSRPPITNVYVRRMSKDPIN